MKKVKARIGDLFKVFDLLNIELNTPFENKHDIFVKTPHQGYQRLNYFVRKHDNAVEVTTDANKSFIASENHIVITTNGQEYISNAETLLTVKNTVSFENIVMKQSVGKIDLYDIGIDNPHLYCDANGFVHHNTTIARALCNEVGADVLFINGSDESGINVLRDKIRQFASTVSFSDAKKVVIIDEADYLQCLEENESVRIGTVDSWIPVKLKDLNPNEEHSVVSFNLQTGELENDTCCIVSDKEDDVYEVTLENGLTVLVTSDHPFIVKTESGFEERNIDSSRLMYEDVVVIDDKPTSKVVSIKKVNRARVINLSVTKNQTFVTGNGIVVHNCNSTQPALRAFMEEFSSNCTFILTCNFKNRIIEPIHSRCAVIDFKIESKDRPKLASDFFKRVKHVLDNEGVEYDAKTVSELVIKFFPDYRRIINELQRYSAIGKIDSGILVVLEDSTYKDLIVHLKNKDFTGTRKWIGSHSDIDTTELYRMLYDKSGTFMEKTSMPQLILILGEYQFRAAFSVDPEINNMACLTEIMSQCVFLP